MSLAPFVVIGCGGSGVLSARHIRDEVRARLQVHGIEKLPAAWQFIGIDAPSVQTDLNEATPLPPLDYLPLRPGATVLSQLEDLLKAAHPPAMRRGYSELIGWRPDPKEFSQNITIGMGGNRAVGREVGALALQSSAIINRIETALTACEGGGPELNSVAQRMGLPVSGLDVPSTNVLVLTSMAGGCGAGISLDVIDLLKYRGSTSLQPILIAYGSDIFGTSRSFMAANNLTYLSELLNAVWSSDGGKAQLFPAPFGRPPRRGPHATFVLGRKNLGGIDLQESRNIYRAAGITIAGWLTSPSVRERFQDHVVANWNSFPRRLGGYGFADSAISGEVSSFGSATIAVGRKRFRDYARKYLLRDLYEHHHRGYKKVARSLFGEDGDRGIDVAIKARLVDRFTPEIIAAFGLANAFDAAGGIVSDGSAQISDELLSVGHVRKMSTEVESALLARLPGESLRGSEWSSIISDELSVLKRGLLNESIDAYRMREEAWLADLVKRVMRESNKYLTRLTLPVMIDLTQSVIEHVGRTAIEFKNSAAIAEEKSREFAMNGSNELADVASNNLLKDSPHVKGALEYISASVGQEMKTQVSMNIAQTLEQVIINLLQPLNSAMRRAKDEVDKVADVTRAGQASVISEWPEGTVVPKAFIPSPIEHLLEGHEEWPTTIERLLRTAEKIEVGESTLDAVRRGISTGLDIPGDIGTNDLRPLLWTRNDAPLDFVRTAPLPIDLDLSLSSLEERVERWLGKPGRELGDYLREGLQQYLRDPMHPEHNVRLRRFKEKFQSALDQASPFVSIDRVYFGTAYPGAELSMLYIVEPIPFQDGHPAHQIAEDAIRNKVQDSGQVIQFSDQDRESVTVSCFFAKPFFPGVVSSMMDDIAHHGTPLLGMKPSNLRGWLDFKRSRTLDEFVPLPEVVTRALVRGFIIGRLCGLVKVPSQGDSAIEIAGSSQVEQFPFPAYSNARNPIVSLLMSFPLCFLTVARSREKAFAAYARLYELGVVGDDPSPQRFSIGGAFEEYLLNGNMQLRSIDSPQCDGPDRDSRIATAIADIDKKVEWLVERENRPFDGTEFVGQGVAWGNDDVPVIEIASLLREEYENVKRALEVYRGTARSDDPQF